MYRHRCWCMPRDRSIVLSTVLHALGFIGCVLVLACGSTVCAQQTRAPTGADYLAWLPRDGLVTLSSRSPFFTPRNASCAGPQMNAGPRTADDVALRDVLRAATQQRENTIVLFYGGRWCVWSSAFRPVWARAAARFPNLCLIALDAYEYPALNPSFGVHAFPTVLRFQSGQVRDRYVGNRSAADLISWIVNVTGTAPQYDGDDSGVEDLFLTSEWLNELKEKPSTPDWILVVSSIISVVASVYRLGLFAAKKRLDSELHVGTSDSDADQYDENGIQPGGDANVDEGAQDLEHHRREPVM